MAILNYSSVIPEIKTAAEIQQKLVSAGVRSVITEYDPSGKPQSISFRITNMYFKLNINVDGVFEALKNGKDKNGKKIPLKYKNKEQASRTAWRIRKDWIEAQLAIIEAGQAELTEVFLPYAQNVEGKTLFEVIKSSEFKLLKHDPM